MTTWYAHFGPGSPPTNWPCKAMATDCTYLTFAGWQSQGYWCLEEYDWGLLAEHSTSIKHSSYGSFHQVQVGNQSDGCPLNYPWPFADKTKLYFRFYIYTPYEGTWGWNQWYDGDISGNSQNHIIGLNDMATVNDRILIDLADHTAPNYLGCWKTGEHAFFRLTRGVNVEFADATKSCWDLFEHMDQWNCIEFMFDVAAGKYAQWVNGVQVVGTDGNGVDCDFSPCTGFGSDHAGGDGCIGICDYRITDSVDRGCEYYIDDIALGDEYIGPLDEGSASASPSGSPSLSPSASVSPSVSPSGSPSVSPSASPSEWLANPCFILADSTYLTDGEATTYQLTAPATKDTDDFQAGKAHDTSNPGDAIDLVADKYTEVEFCIKATDAGEVDATYEFRVTKAWTPRDIGGCVLWLRSDLGVTNDGNPTYRVSEWADQSGNLNHATQITDAKKFVWYDGTPSYLLSDNVDDYMDCGNNASLQITGDFTGVFWIKDLTCSDNALLAKWVGTVGYMVGYNTTIRIYSDNSWMGLATDITTETATWLNIALVKNGAAGLIYFNGVPQTMAGGPLNVTQGNPAENLLVGTYANALGGKTIAKWGEKTLYNRALLGSEVLTYFNNTKARYGL